jgi:hypothetical protein
MEKYLGPFQTLCNMSLLNVEWSCVISLPAYEFIILHVLMQTPYGPARPPGLGSNYTGVRVALGIASTPILNLAT